MYVRYFIVPEIRLLQAKYESISCKPYYVASEILLIECCKHDKYDHDNQNDDDINDKTDDKGYHSKIKRQRFGNFIWFSLVNLE